MTTTNKSIILYPHEYNLRGGDSKGSVKGVTHDGELVNIKLRVTGSIRNKDAVPSISKFAKTSMEESRQSCLSSFENNSDNPLGILVFMDCHPEKARDPDSEYSTYYISRWAQILRNGHNRVSPGDEGDLPFIGYGRLVIDKNVPIVNEAIDKISTLEKIKPDNWEKMIEENRAISENYLNYNFFLYGYMPRDEVIINSNNDDKVVGFMSQTIDTLSRNSSNGFLIRSQIENGPIIKELVSEVFPMYLIDKNRFQNALELFSFFKASNPEIQIAENIEYRVMPIVRFSGKKIFKDSIKSHSEFKILEETYYIGGDPQVFEMCAKIDRLSNKERLLNKIILTGPSIGSPITLKGNCDEEIHVRAFIHGESIAIERQGQQAPSIFSSEIGSFGSIPFAKWYSPEPLNQIDLIKIRETILKSKIKKSELSEIAPAVVESEEVESLQPKAGFEDLELPGLISEGSSNALEDQENELDSIDDIFSEGEEGEEKPDPYKDTEDDDLFSGSDMDHENIEDENYESPSLFGSRTISFDSLGKPLVAVSTSEQEDINMTPDNQSDDLMGAISEPHADQFEGTSDSDDEAESAESNSTVLDSNEDEESLSNPLDCPENNDLKISEKAGVESIIIHEEVFDKVPSEQSEVELTENSFIDDEDLDPWLDEDELEVNLSEAPDAYSELTQDGSMGVTLEDIRLEDMDRKAKEVLIEIEASHALSDSHGTPGLSSDNDQNKDASAQTQIKAKKGGLAKFMRKRKGE